MKDIQVEYKGKKFSYFERLGRWYDADAGRIAVSSMQRELSEKYPAVTGKGGPPEKITRPPREDLLEMVISHMSKGGGELRGMEMVPENAADILKAIRQNAGGFYRTRFAGLTYKDKIREIEKVIGKSRKTA